MASFALLAAGLVLMVTALALWPLWRAARALAGALVLTVLAASAGLYALVGTPDALDPRNVQAPRSLEEAISQLERRLQREPGELQGWLLLGRSRAAQGQFAQARDAFARAHALVPDDLDLMVEYADAQLRAASDGHFPEPARVLLERVVASNPDHQRGLFLLGLQRLQTERAAEALALWEHLLGLVEPATADALRPQIAAARAEAGLPAATATTPSAARGPTLQIALELAPELAARVPDTAVLYLFARTPDGAGLPVAVKRQAATGFPLRLSLSDRDGLMPSQKLSMQSKVRLLARISFSGDAAGAAGDFEATPIELAVRDGATATLRIDQVRK